MACLKAFVFLAALLFMSSVATAQQGALGFRGPAYRFVPQGQPKIYRRYYWTPIRDFLFGRYRVYQPGRWQPGYWQWVPYRNGEQDSVGEQKGILSWP